MPAPAHFLLIAALLPLLGFALLLIIGKRLGTPLAGWTASSFIIASFGCTLVAMVKWYEGAPGAENWGLAVRPIFRSFTWFPASSGKPPGLFEIGVYIDSLTIAMFAMVTLVGGVVYIYSIGFLRREEDSSRFFACLGFAVFAMLGMALSGTLLQLLAMFILIGLSSTLLAGGAFDLRTGPRATARIFIINRIGDCGLLLGFALLFSKLGNTSLPNLWATLGDASAGRSVLLPDGRILSSAYITLAGLSLFCGAAARCALFPFHPWFADASAGPVPGVAMITSVTSGAAGVYLAGRLFPILTPDAKLLITILSLTTISMSCLISLAQRDLPRLLAWISVAQLGYMMLAMGVGSWVGGLFAVMTNAFVMVCLQLAAGSIISANAGQRDILKLAGGWKQLPVTAAAFAVAALAMAGAPLLSKYYSQAMIADAAAAFAVLASAAGRSRFAWLIFILPTAGAFFIAFSIARCWMLIFAARRGLDFESPAIPEQPAMWAPLLVLVLPAIVAGYAMNIPELLQRSMLETTAFCEELRARAGAGADHFQAFDQSWPAVQQPVPAPDAIDAIDTATPAPSRASDAFERGHLLARNWYSWIWLAGIISAVALYWPGRNIADRIVRRAPFRWMHIWLESEMFFVELYDWTIARAVSGLAVACDAFERFVLDGSIRGAVWIMRKFRQRFWIEK